MSTSIRWISLSSASLAVSLTCAMWMTSCFLPLTKRALHIWRQEIIRLPGWAAPDAARKPGSGFPGMTGIPFLGFRLFPNHRRLNARKVVSFRRKLKRLARSIVPGTRKLAAWRPASRVGSTMCAMQIPGGCGGPSWEQCAYERISVIYPHL